MFYVYKNTRDNYKVIAEFSDKESALLFMEGKALGEGDPEVLGFAVRDYLMNVCAEYEL